ncbi:hypothetical protein U4E84_04240 [Halorubrum sp. AD140]|uniref:hypothetical protein n=1 Tax=Halorubrum sp. AD140 TaxID=3050073 RepID=UPI002ACCF8D2|nr:hypothetical protein [Halorubrum sp. AD140]MDZ5810558.1 hypothetical protein [Halorubrum sp. AD140]
MELVTNTTHIHGTHGRVTIEKIYREYSVYDTERGHGSVPGAWYIQYLAVDGDMYTDTVDGFVEAITGE